MKHFSIIIFIVLFNSISNKTKTYELIDGIEYTINNLTAKETYYFKCYTLPLYSKIVNVSFTINSTNVPFTHVYIYEYSSDTSKTSLSSKYQSITTSKINNEYISSFLYSITNFDTRFISLEIVPSYHIDYIKFFITLIQNKFDLSNGVEKKTTNLKSGFLYYFYISCHLLQSASINLSTNTSKYSWPFNYFHIYEYSDRHLSKYIKTTSLSSSSHLNYQVSDNNTKDIALEIKPNYDLDYITVKIDVDNITFDLSNGVETNVTNLKSGNPYYFFIPLTIFQKVTLILTMNSTNIDINDYIYVYEHRNRSILDYILKTTYKVPSSSVISLSYLVENYYTKYISLNIIPKRNLDCINVKTYVHNNTFNLSNGVAKNITNLKAGNEYYFLIPSTQFQQDTISLTMSEINLNNLYIYEYDFSSISSSLNYRKVDNKSITVSTLKNEYKSSFRYIINDYYTTHIVLKITPSYDLNYCSITINIDGGIYDLIDSVDKNINYLKAGISYYFFIKSTLFQKDLITATMNYMDLRINDPLKTFYIYELKNRTNIIKSTLRYYDISNENNQLKSSFNYSVEYYETKYIALNITPIKDINNFTININVQNGAFDLTKGSTKKINNLKYNNEYYFYIPSTLLQSVSFSLTMNYTDPQPFDYLYIYEYKSRTNKNYYNEILYRPIKTSEGRSELSYSFEYFVMNRDTNYIALQVKPNKYMEYLSINANIEIYSYELTNGQKKTFNNLKYGKQYYIYIDMNNKRKIKVNLDTYTTNPFSYLYIYELNNYYNISSYIKKENKALKIEGNEENVSFIYTTSEADVKQVVLEITASYSTIISEFEYLVYIPNGIILLLVFICLCLIIFLSFMSYKCKQRKTTNLNEVPMIQPLQPIDETPQEDYSRNQPCSPETPSETPYSEQQQYNQPH